MLPDSISVPTIARPARETAWNFPPIVLLKPYKTFRALDRAAWLLPFLPVVASLLLTGAIDTVFPLAHDLRKTQVDRVGFACMGMTIAVLLTSARAAMEAAVLRWSAGVFRRNLKYGDCLLIVMASMQAIAMQTLVACTLLHSHLLRPFGNATLASLTTPLGVSIAAAHYGWLTHTAVQSLVNMANLGEIYKVILEGIGLCAVALIPKAQAVKTVALAATLYAATIYLIARTFWN